MKNPAYSEGWACASNNGRESQNHYPAGSKEHAAWLQGFRDQCTEFA